MSNEMSTKDNIINLRCFVYFNMEHQKFYAFCIDLNLACQADSLDSVLDKMRDAIMLYIESQLEYNKENNITAFSYRRSPLSIRFNYFIGFFGNHLKKEKKIL